MHFYLILHNIRSLHNVGSIFRTADGAGVDKIFLTGYTGLPVDRLGKTRKEIHKVALGAEKVVEWQQYKNISELIKKLKREKIFVVALEQHPKSIDYKKFVNALSNISKQDTTIMHHSTTMHYSGRRKEQFEKQFEKQLRNKFKESNGLALVVGNEVRGLSNQILKKCDKIIEIPMHGEKESLNVSVATGIALYSIRDFLD